MERVEGLVSVYRAIKKYRIRQVHVCGKRMVLGKLWGCRRDSASRLEKVTEEGEQQGIHSALLFTFKDDRHHASVNNHSLLLMKSCCWISSPQWISSCKYLPEFLASLLRAGHKAVCCVRVLIRYTPSYYCPFLNSWIVALLSGTFNCLFCPHFCSSLLALLIPQVLALGFWPLKLLSAIRVMVHGLLLHNEKHESWLEKLKKT